MRRLLAICLVHALAGCGPMEDSSDGTGERSGPGSSPPSLGLIQFSQTFHVPPEFESASNDGLICIDQDINKPVSPAIKKIIAGRRWERTAKDAPWEEMNSGKSIRPCAVDFRGNSTQRRSALDALIAIFDSMHGLVAGLEPVTVELFPAFVNIDGNTRTYATGDMFYDAGRKTIVILPPSSPQAEAGLWTSGFVIAHELVHHALETQVRAVTAGLVMPDWCEEGHADAIAFQMTDRNSAGVRQLPGFGIDRDPSWPRFTDGTRKEDLDLSIAGPPHRKGAALAHRLDLQPAFKRLFSRSLSAPFKVVIDTCPEF